MLWWLEGFFATLTRLFFWCTFNKSKYNPGLHARNRRSMRGQEPAGALASIWSAECQSVPLPRRSVPPPPECSVAPGLGCSASWCAWCCWRSFFLLTPYIAIKYGEWERLRPVLTVVFWRKETRKHGSFQRGEGKESTYLPALLNGLKMELLSKTWVLALLS